VIKQLVFIMETGEVSVIYGLMPKRTLKIFPQQWFIVDIPVKDNNTRNTMYRCLRNIDYDRY
jgi:hypothetical protein